MSASSLIPLNPERDPILVLQYIAASCMFLYMMNTENKQDKFRETIKEFNNDILTRNIHIHLCYDAEEAKNLYKFSRGHYYRSMKSQRVVGSNSNYVNISHYYVLEIDNVRTFNVIVDVSPLEKLHQVYPRKKFLPVKRLVAPFRHPYFW